MAGRRVKREEVEGNVSEKHAKTVSVTIPSSRSKSRHGCHVVFRSVSLVRNAVAPGKS
jgi:hypothetical protein